MTSKESQPGSDMSVSKTDDFVTVVRHKMEGHWFGR